ADITANQIQLAELENILKELQTEIRRAGPKQGPAYNEKVDQYNELFSQYNQLFEQNQDLINEYNNQVVLFNECVASF
ncbi:MAG: hypothetical protein KGZ85_15325, partial [Ignavibacterium sp.]|nr:hypothetical protein [Ignavibacterium sp.]